MARHRRLGAELSAGQIFGERDPLPGGEGRALRLHHAMGEGIDDEARRHRAQTRARGRARCRDHMAGGAVPLEQRGLRARIRRLSRARARPQCTAQDRRRDERKPTASLVPGPLHQTPSLTRREPRCQSRRPAPRARALGLDQGAPAAFGANACFTWSMIVSAFFARTSARKGPPTRSAPNIAR